MTPDQEVKLLETVAEIHHEVTVITTNCQRCRTDVARHEKILNGNNGDGLKTAVAMLESKRWMERLFSIVILALLGGLLTIAGAGKVAEWVSPAAAQQQDK